MFVAVEAAPFASVGGLGEVVGSLPKALANLGVEMSIFMPRYRFIPPTFPKIATLSVDFAGKSQEIRVLQGFLPKSRVPVYFLDFPPYYDRPEIYGEGDQPYPDNLQRFAFLCKAAVRVGFSLEGPPDIFHVHDWHAALLPVYVRTEGVEAKTVLTIHNLADQGWFPRETWEDLGLPEESLRLAGEGERLCTLRAGILGADAITTVSPSYAKEILTDGLGLDEVLHARAQDLVGILNGIDVEEWDPANDGYIWARYSARDLRPKAFNRRKLLADLGLSGNGPVVAMVGRVAEQKGFDLLVASLDRLMALGINLVVLGSGKSRYEAFLKDAEKSWPGRVRALLFFSRELAHKIFAGADFLLMPSLFEPCGLAQLYALRYGTIPIVRATGGLRDTVRDVKEGGNGFVFEEYTPEALVEAVRRAVSLWRKDRRKLLDLRRVGMSGDYSWRPAAQKYREIYERVLSR